MKQITEIHFVNYKGFYGDGPRNTVRILDGKRNLLIYGENGSGKSSIYEGLRQFFDGSESPAMNIHVSDAGTVIGSTRPQKNGMNDFAVEVTFKDNLTGNLDMKSYGFPNTIGNTNYIIEAGRLNSFFSYRELLRTYLIEKPRDERAFWEQFTELVIGTILAKNINSATGNKYHDDWEELHQSNARKAKKQAKLGTFVIGLKEELSRINIILNDLLRRFESGVETNLLVMPGYFIEKGYSKKKGANINYPELFIGLEASLYGRPLDEDVENHLTVLNEARLSSLAICTYLASLMVTPQGDLDYKILFFDDIFIGLDSSNRLPLLDILNKYRKPITKTVTNGEGELEEVIDLNEDDSPKQEERPFFEDYQVFLATHDRHWFEIAKERLNPNTWHNIEMYAHFDRRLGFEVPLIMPSEGYFEKAEAYFWGGKRKDYPATANYLRKELESQLKERLLYDRYKYEKMSNGEITLLDTLGELWSSFKRMFRDLGLPITPYKDFTLVISGVLNPFSHSNLSKPIYRQELIEAFRFVEKIRSLKMIKVIGIDGVLRLRVGKTTCFFKAESDTRVYIQQLEGTTNTKWVLSVVSNFGKQVDDAPFAPASDKDTEYSLEDAIKSAYTEQGSDISTIGSVTSIVQMDGTTLDDILAQKLAAEGI